MNYGINTSGKSKQTFSRVPLGGNQVPSAIQRLTYYMQTRTPMRRGHSLSFLYSMIPIQIEQRLAFLLELTDNAA